MLGMAVDANVLIYERLREERDRGASLTLAIRNGYDRAFPTIIDTHLISIFTAIVLYVVGNDQLKGFGISLTVGLIISLFTSLYMTRLMFDFWQSKGWLQKLSMYQGLRTVLTGLHRLHGHPLLLVHGHDHPDGHRPGRVPVPRPAGLNIDFVGGTAYGGQLKEPKRIDQLRDLLDHKHQEAQLKIKSVQQANESGKLFNIEYTDGPQESVAFKEPIAGATNQDREKNVAELAATLPDWSVVQTFLSSEEHSKRQPHLHG